MILFIQTRTDVTTICLRHLPLSCGQRAVNPIAFCSTLGTMHLYRVADIVAQIFFFVNREGGFFCILLGKGCPFSVQTKFCPL